MLSQQILNEIDRSFGRTENLPGLSEMQTERQENYSIISRNHSFEQKPAQPSLGKSGREREMIEKTRQKRIARKMSPFPLLERSRKIVQGMKVEHQRWCWQSAEG